MASQDHPLSPHLQVYRPQITSVLSILHRMTGVCLSLGAPLLLYWLVAAASGPASYTRAIELLGSVPGLIVLVTLTFCFFYHLANGIRHLFWDTGRGFELEQLYASGWAVVVVSLGLTLLLWAYALMSGGGA